MVPLSYNHPKTRKLDLQLVLTDTILYSNLNSVYIVKCCPGKKKGTLLAETTCCERFLKRKKIFHPCQSLSTEKTWLRRERGREGFIKEIEIHVYAKPVPRDQVFLLIVVHCLLLLHKKSSFTPVLSIRIVLGCFYLLIFYFEKFSTWICGRFAFAVNVTLNLSIIEKGWPG